MECCSSQRSHARAPYFSRIQQGQFNVDGLPVVAVTVVNNRGGRGLCSACGRGLCSAWEREREGEGGEREKRGGREGWMEGRESQFKTYK